MEGTEVMELMERLGILMDPLVQAVAAVAAVAQPVTSP